VPLVARIDEVKYDRSSFTLSSIAGDTKCQHNQPQSTPPGLFRSHPSFFSFLTRKLLQSSPSQINTRFHFSLPILPFYTRSSFLSVYCIQVTMEATSPMAPHDEVHVEGDFDSPGAGPISSNLPFSATCIRIARDSYPNLRAMASAANLSDEAASSKTVEGEYGYILEDVPHFTDYLPDLPVSSSISVFFGNPLKC
jgi:hypothetical protein